MSLTIDLSPELERRLAEEAARRGQGAAEFARSVLEERLTTTRSAEQIAAQVQRNQRAIALLRQWSAEDAASPDPSPVPEIPPLSLREVKID
jgi:hypothetical protein